MLQVLGEQNEFYSNVTCRRCLTSNFLQNFNSKNDKSRIHTVSVKSIQNFFLLNIHTVTTPTSRYVN